MPSFKLLSLLTFCSLFLVLAILTGWSLAAESAKRARPPRWSRDVLDAFFDDASAQLVGARPQHAELNASRAIATQGPGADKQPVDTGQEKWSTLISAETLTAEIKRINNRLAQTLKKSSTFQAGGNMVCRRDFGLLSVLFGVIDEFDEDVRWQRSAKQMQARCFRASQNCQAASPRSYAAAKEMQVVLAELLRGQAPTSDEESQAAAEDPLIIEITQIMQSMEVAMKEGLAPTLADAREFRKRSFLAAEQSQLLAVLAKLAQHEEYGYEDEDTYLEESRQLIQAAEELFRATEDKNYTVARQAAGRMSQACSRCHEGYR